jgi:glycosyltransferase involved in cell wall biosynthesis
MKIAVYAISKNEEQFVKRFCESAKDADLILIADTGSEDDTVPLAKDCGASVYQVSVNPWRFDTARNAALTLIPSDIDVCITMDLDEVLLPGWRKEVEKLWTGEVNRIQHLFDNGDGLVFRVSRIHSRHGNLWKYPCHEYVVADKRHKEVMAHTDFVFMKHMPDKTKSRGQYLPMLEMAVQEDSNCHRSQFYYARELSFKGRWEDSKREFKKFLDMPTATWNVERGYACRMIGSCEELLGNNGDSWFYKSIAEDPNAREAWIELATKNYKTQNWEKCYLNAKSALQIKEKQNWHTTDANTWGWYPHDLLAISAYHLKLKDEAIKHGTIAVQLDPSNKRLQNNLKHYKE